MNSEDTKPSITPKDGGPYLVKDLEHLQNRHGPLEAKAVILCDVARDDPRCSPKHLYVGTSRAQHLLTVLSYE